MEILFIHQGFPGQFKHLAPALAALPGIRVRALKYAGTDKKADFSFKGVEVLHYNVSRGTTRDIHPWVGDFESKVIRGEACYNKALELREQGYSPDVIVAHHGWGESLFLKEVWPDAKLGLYCEYFYRTRGGDIGFDPEFEDSKLNNPCRLHLKNVNNRLHFEQADGAISPTAWQANTFPASFRDKITVVHDGIDTGTLAPRPETSVTLDGLTLGRDDEVITFVNRNLEPVRGYHIFMRALPELLAARPNAQVVIVGGSGTSYGAKPKGNATWKQTFIDEVRHQIPDGDWRRVHFVGNLPYDRFVDLLRVSTVHVYLTYPFVLSWSLIEAMSLGCAIVASDTAPVTEVISDGETGRLVNFFDSAALVTAVSSLLDNPAERERLGAAARAKAIAHYDLKRHCLPRQIQWVQGLAGRQPGQGPNQAGGALNIVALGLKKFAGVTEARIDYPLQALNREPDIKCTWSDKGLKIPAKTPPGILILHRQFFDKPAFVDTMEKLAARGWVLVSDMDDDPHHWRQFVETDFRAYRGVHAVTVSTEPLAAMIRAWNPHVQVFPNAIAEMPEISPASPKEPGRVRLFFGAINRKKDWLPVIDGIAAAAREFKGRLAFEVVHDREFFDALPAEGKTFHATLAPTDYMALLASCDISLLPLADTPFNRLKSDLKFIESCAAGAVPVCSPIVYATDIRHRAIGCFAESAEQWRQAITALCENPVMLEERRNLGLEYVKECRLHSHQVPSRKAFYQSLLANRDKLEADRQQRLAQWRARRR